jgi:hypothetical protein
VLVAFEITPGIATMIGAGAAIVGGLLAALYESRRTRQLALELRAIERQEEALRMLAPLTNEIAIRMGMWLGNVRGSPEQLISQPGGEGNEFQGQLNLMWERELSWRLRDEAVRASVMTLISALRQVGVATEQELSVVCEAAASLKAEIDRVLQAT